MPTFDEFPLAGGISLGPFGIAAGSDGNLWFTETDTGNIGRISPMGAVDEFPLPDASSGPLGIAAGPDGNLWFTEMAKNQIGRITPQSIIAGFAIPPSGGLIGLGVSPLRMMPLFAAGSGIGAVDKSMGVLRVREECGLVSDPTPARAAGG